jgi:hypothetical protein
MPQNPVPVAVVPGGPTISIPGAPQTAQDVAALRARGSELAGQLESARSRRDAVVRQIRRGDPDVAGLQQQVSFLDARVLQIETDISANSHLIANAAAGALTPPVPPFSRGRRMTDATPIYITFTLFVLAPLAIGYVWRSLRRPVQPTLPTGWSEHLHRMDHLEQAVDTIAIEIERISEGQRFLTRVMSERQAQTAASPDESAAPRALGAGPAMPIVQEHEREKVRVV